MLPGKYIEMETEHLLTEVTLELRKRAFLSGIWSGKRNGVYNLEL